MKIALSVKNKLGFIDGSITRQVGNDDLLNFWVGNNNIVISWILNNPRRYQPISYAELAYEIWTDHKEISTKVWSSHFSFETRIGESYSGTVIYEVYFTKLKKIGEELSNYRPMCSCGKCDCRDTKELVDYYHIELNDFFLLKSGVNCY